MKNKIIAGFVCQSYNDDGTPSSQSFIASDEETWEDLNGDACDAPDNPQTFHMNMEQPDDAKKLTEMKETILGYEAEEYDRQIGEQRNG